MDIRSITSQIRDRLENPWRPIPKTKKMLKALNTIETAQDVKTITRSAGKIMVAVNDAGMAYADACRKEVASRADFWHFGNLTVIEYLAEQIMDGNYD